MILRTAFFTAVVTTSTTAQQLLGNHFGPAGTPATYDYIVVGGGNAGLAVASRLAEDGTKTVAVIEAGGFWETDGGNTSTVPSYCVQYGEVTKASADMFPLTDWGFLTTPQAGMNNRTLHYGRGKMLGGSSAENAMIYNRGTTGSFQQWADAVNDNDWTYGNVLPYYAKSVHYTPSPMYGTSLRTANASNIPLPADSAAISATGGPVQLSYPYSIPFSSWAQLGLREIGFPDQQDFLSGNLLGAQYASVSVDPESRERSSSRTYLDPYLKVAQTNLRIYTHTLAKKILFSNGTIATGVTVQSGRVKYNLTARAEVILSAGAFQSPQLLMVSGIGPRAQLEKYNISVIADRPGVGQNMWDHLDFGPTYRINLPGLTPAYSANNQHAVDEYLANRTGILTSPGVEYIGWEKVPASLRANFSSQALADLGGFSADWPEIEYEIAQTNLGGAPDPFGIYATAIAVLVAPLSRGNVSIVSNDTADLPVIDPNWLTHPTDQQVAVAGFRRARQMFQSTAVQPIIIGEEISPGLNVTSDADILEWIRNNAYQNWHASCTCKMGNLTDPTAVVDSQARVIGVSNLRVVDASSFALLPPGHPQSTVYMLAEKIAADIMNSTHSMTR